MTLSQLLQNAILADFALDPNLQQYPLRPHDYGGRKAGDDIYPDSKEESLVVTTVTVHNSGQFYPMSPIYKLIVDVQVVYNGAADNFNGQLVDTLADAASDRMQPSQNMVNGIGREDNFSSPLIKVYGIVADQPSNRENSSFQRIRHVGRSFIVAQVAGSVS